MRFAFGVWWERAVVGTPCDMGRVLVSLEVWGHRKHS